MFSTGQITWYIIMDSNIDVDFRRLIDFVVKETGVPRDIVEKVLRAERKYFMSDYYD